MSIFKRSILRVIVASGIGTITSLLLSSCASASDYGHQDVESTIRINGVERSYLVHTPISGGHGARMPLILAFHGGGMNGKRMAKLTRFDSIADEKGFIVVYPNGLGGHWNDGRLSIRDPHDDVDFVSAIITRLEETGSVDPRRVYATGISNGALFAERLGCDLSSKISGIAPVAGTVPAAIANRCRASQGVAVLQIDGTRDPIMPYGGGKVSTLGGAGEGGYVLSVAATADLWRHVNRCEGPATYAPLPPRDPYDPTRVTLSRYTTCSLGREVRILSVEGGGHTWPGGPQFAHPRIVGLASKQIDASEAISTFFLSLPPS